MLPAVASSGGETKEVKEVDKMETDEKADVEEATEETKPETASELLPEVYVYLANLVATGLLKQKLYKESAVFTTAMVVYSKKFNRRTLDLLVGKMYGYYSMSFERMGQLDQIRRDLLTMFRTASLQHNDFGKAVLLNLLTRNFLAYNLYGRAAALMAKTEPFPDVSNNQLVRHLYYCGKVKSVLLQYTEAFKMLSQALRKVPQNTGRVFRVQIQKLAVLVQLLMGDLPERSVFNQPESRKQLVPYLALAQAMRGGDLGPFQKALDRYAASYEADHSRSLVLRLRNNVLKTGLRRISISYSRVSFADIAAKLRLDSAQDAECVCAKAIRDGVVDAVLDHEQGFMRSKETVDAYSTHAPRRALHLRTCFCLDIHNEAVKAMRYPPDAFKRKAEDGEDVKDEKTLENIAKKVDEKEQKKKKRDAEDKKKGKKK